MIEVTVTTKVREVDDQTQAETRYPMVREVKHLMRPEELRSTKLGESLTAKLKLSHVFEDLLNGVAEDVAGLT